MNICQSLGKRIKFLRQQKGWSQMELSLNSEINKNYISDIERGSRNPTLYILEKLAKTFEITLEELFSGVEDL